MQIIDTPQSLDTFLLQLQTLCQTQIPFLVAIDGPSNSGKTTFGGLLSSLLGCPLFHMDDFYLQSWQRTPQRYQTPGENVDHERFLSEVLLPLSRHEPFDYRPFSCKTMDILDGQPYPSQNAAIIEGSYSLHHLLTPYYSMRILISISPEEQLERLRKRETPSQVNAFLTRWIPLENTYFESTHIEERTDVILRSDCLPAPGH